jgi:hypothetical protein
MQQPNREEVKNFIINESTRCEKEFPRVFWGNLLALLIFLGLVVAAAIFIYAYFLDSDSTGRIFNPRDSYYQRRSDYSMFSYAIIGAVPLLGVAYYLLRSFLKNLWTAGKAVFGYNLQLTEAELELATDLVYSTPLDAGEVYQRSQQDPTLQRVIEVLVLTGVLFEKEGAYSKGDIMNLFTEAELNNWFDQQSAKKGPGN